MKERWLPVVGFKGLYEVSDLGRVRSLDRVDGQGRFWPGRMFRPSIRRDGYLTVRLSDGLRGHSRLVHKLVLDAFVGLRPDNKEARHRNGIKTDCGLANLSWSTHAENCADRKLHGTEVLGERNANAKLTEGCVARIRDMLRLGCPQRAVGGWFSIGQQQISRINTGVRW